VQPPTITEAAELDQLCQRLQSAKQIGIDTEFVSEDTFFPELCLIQVATREELAVIDTIAIRDVRPFWRMLAEGDHVTVLHAGREELNFSLRAADAVPKHLFDVQIAAGFCSHEFPSAYGAVVNKFLRHKPLKGEQRTDWRRRPLTKAQINYALEDVRYLLPLYDRQVTLLSENNRSGWFEEQVADWQNEIVAARTRKNWRRVSGIGKLGPQSLAIVRELWLWRQQEAERLNRPPRRLLRDDLLVEIAKRKVDRPDQVMAIRGMQRGALKQKADELADCVRRGLESPLDRSAKAARRHVPSQLNLLGQFLAPALGTLCRRAEIAASMVGTASDVRDLVAYRLGFSRDGQDETPALTRGWRAQLVGNVIDELLEGKKSIRILNARDDDPLVIDDVS